MVATHSKSCITARLLLGFFGATLITIMPFMRWLDRTPPWEEVKYFEMGIGIVYVLCWLGAIIWTASETEQHYYSCFFKGVGLPGVWQALIGFSQSPEP